MTEHFKSIIAGFADTLPLIAKSTGKKGKGQNKLKNLVKKFDINTDEAHNALQDVKMIQQVLRKLKISNQEILKATVSWSLYGPFKPFRR